MTKQFLRFLVVGSCGFIVDAGILSLCVHLFDSSPYWSRIPSFAVAVTLTWYLNYKWAFEAKLDTRKLVSFSRYLLVQGAGISINIAVYIVSLYVSEYFFEHPEFAVALASVVALFFNYFGLKKWVFKYSI